MKRTFLPSWIIPVVISWAGLVLPAAASDVPGGLLEALTDYQEYEAWRASTADTTGRNADARAIAPGATLVLADLEGPGEITHLWFTISSLEKSHLRTLVLKMYWDDQMTPSVLCPVGDFFAQGHGRYMSFESCPLSIGNQRGLNSFWRMPFRKRARIEITNEGQEACVAFYAYVDYRKLRVPPNRLRFHASYRQEFPCRPDSRYLLLDAEGQGHYVGTILSVDETEPGWWGEGDDIFIVDGETRLWGTGSEDYFCHAWGMGAGQSRLFFGCPFGTDYNTGGMWTQYRFHIPDPIPFKKNLRVEMEHYGARQRKDGSWIGFVERADHWSSVAIWYQELPHKPLPPLPPAQERVPPSFRNLVECEDLINQAEISPGDVCERQDIHDDAQLWLKADAVGDYVTIPLETEISGEQYLRLILTGADDYGLVQVYIDGNPVGDPIDCFNDREGLWVTHVIQLYELIGPVGLESGVHKVCLEVTGKAERSRGYLVGLDAAAFVANP
ncbi:MAG: glycoside hydrolase family 172 protein [bacterium]